MRTQGLADSGQRGERRVERQRGRRRRPAARRRSAPSDSTMAGSAPRLPSGRRRCARRNTPRRAGRSAARSRAPTIAASSGRARRSSARRRTPRRPAARAERSAETAAARACRTAGAPAGLPKNAKHGDEQQQRGRREYAARRSAPASVVRLGDAVFDDRRHEAAEREQDHRRHQREPRASAPWRVRPAPAAAAGAPGAMTMDTAIQESAQHQQEQRRGDHQFVHAAAAR